MAVAAGTVGVAVVVFEFCGGGATDELERVVALGDDAVAGEDAVDDLDEALVAQTDDDGGADKLGGFFSELEEDEEIAALAEDGGAGDGDGVGRGGGDKGEASAHAGEEPGVGVGDVNKDAERATGVVELGGGVFDAAGEGVVGEGGGVEVHELAGAHGGDLGFGYVGDDVDLAEVDDGEQGAVGLDRGAGGDVDVEDNAVEGGDKRDERRRVGDDAGLDLDEQLAGAHGLAVVDEETGDAAGDAGGEGGDFAGLGFDATEGGEGFFEGAELDLGGEQAEVLDHGGGEADDAVVGGGECGRGGGGGMIGVVGVGAVGAVGVAVGVVVIVMVLVEFAVDRVTDTEEGEEGE